MLKMFENIKEWLRNKFFAPKPPIKESNPVLEDDSGKVIKILKKDSFDEEFSSLVETGFISPLEYYRWKKIHQMNDES